MKSYAPFLAAAFAIASASAQATVAYDNWTGEAPNGSMELMATDAAGESRLKRVVAVRD